MKKYALIIAILLLSVVLLNAKTEKQTFMFSQKLVGLSLDNVKVESVSFHRGKEIEIRYDQDDVIFNQEKNSLSIISPHKKAKIWLTLPADKKYHTQYDEGNIYFTPEGLTLLGTDYQEIFIDGKIIKILKDKAEVLVYENGDLVIKDEDGNQVIFNEEGIIKTGDNKEEDNEGMTNFWGKAIAAIVRVAVRTAMNAIGETPEEVIVTVLNEKSWKIEINDMMDVVESNAPHFGAKRFTKEIERSFPSEQIQFLSIDNFNGSVEIEGSDQDQLQVTIWIACEAEEDTANVEIEFQEGSDFLIKSKPLIKDIHCSIKYQIALPQNIALKNILSSNGSISVSGCQGTAELMTSNGSIDVEDYQGDLVLRTSNGSVDTEDIKGNVDIRSSNGGIEAQNISGDVSALTSNGKIEIKDCLKIKKTVTSNSSIRLEIGDLEENLLVSTSNAEISLILAKSLNCRIEARTSIGAIKLHDIKLDIKKSDKNRLVAEFNKGGKLLEAETSNASINFYQK